MSDGNRCAPVTRSRPFGRGDRRAHHLPLLDGRERHARGRRLAERLGHVLAGRQVGVGRVRACPRRRRPCRRGLRRRRARRPTSWAARPARSSRAAAAPCRTAGTVDGVERLPAVIPSSGTRAVSAIRSVDAGRGHAQLLGGRLASARPARPGRLRPCRS